MKALTSFGIFGMMICVALVGVATAFAPQPSLVASKQRMTTHLNIFDEKERKALTRDTEPEDYFQT